MREYNDKINHAAIRKPAAVISMDHLLPNMQGSVFLLTRMAMVRALEIHFGSKPLIEHGPTDKETTIALREISQGKINCKAVTKKPEPEAS